MTEGKLRHARRRTSARAAEGALTVRRRRAIPNRLAVGVVVTPRGGTGR